MAKGEFKTQFPQARQIGDYYETIVVNPIGDPPFTPKANLYDQHKIVVDSLTSPTARRLYIYSFSLKDWLYIALST